MSVHGGESDEEGDVFLDEEDVIQDIAIDEEDLPDRDEEMGSDDDVEEADDSIYVFKGHSDELYTVACNPTNASLVATRGKDDRKFLWKIGSADTGHQDTVSTVVFSFDGQLLATGSFDGLIYVWDTSSGSLKCTLEGSGEGFEWFRWHPRGHLIAVGSEDANVWMWNADKGKLIWGYGTLRWERVSISLKVISSLIAHSNSVRVQWTYAKVGWIRSSLYGMCNALQIQCTCDHEEGVTCLAWLGHSQYVATGCVDGKVRIWDSLSVAMQTPLQSLAVSANGNCLGSVSDDGTAQCLCSLREFR